MTVLDAACLVALFRGEPGAPAVAKLLNDADHQALLSVLNRAEVIDRLARQGADPGEVAADLDMLGIASHDVTSAIGDRAGALRAAHYHRTSFPLSMSDCVAAATAELLGAPLATSDGHLTTLATILDVPTIGISNSHGKRPTS